MKKYLFLLLISPISFLFAQNEIRKTNIDLATFRSQLSNSPTEINLGIGKTYQSTTILSLPFFDGTVGNFQMVEYSILPEGVETDIKTFYGQNVDDHSISCRISLTKNWMIATIYTKTGIVVIEKSKQSTNVNEYDVYLQSQNEFECKAENSIDTGGRLRDIEGIKNYTNGANLRTYRMAIMVTNEFYTGRGNSDATVNAEVTAIINSLNGLYEKELAIRFTLVTPNNPSSSNVFYRKTTDINTYYQDVDIIRAEMNTRYGVANYDLGHCLHTTGGGLAYYGVCDNRYKGGAWSGSTNPSSILLMAHEVGHQFTAPHTFLGNGNSNCSDGNRSLQTAYEPGSGNTIMSYAGLCSNLQNISGGKVPYFHTNSLQNMILYIQSGTGNTCGIPTPSGNTPPVAVAGTGITIPKNTPFTLTGSGTDINGDELTYTWEQYDLPVANDVGALGSSTNGVGGYAAINSTTAPLFKSKQSSSPERIFPSLFAILNNANNPADTEGEDLPQVARTMNFRFTVRDNKAGGGGVDSDAIVVTVDNSGPFLITSQNTNTYWSQGSSKLITWSVNGTNAAPLNCTAVDILFSSDGGATFPTILIANTPNDGSQSITVPSVLTSTGRIKIIPSNMNLIFFDINNSPITVVSALPTCVAEASSLTPSASVTALAGAAALNLNLYPHVVATNISRTTAVTDPTMPLIGYNGSSCVIPYSNIMYYKKYTFRVSANGSYTFTIQPTVNSRNINLFTGSFMDGCTNWIGGTINMASSPVYGNTITATLSVNTTYVMTIASTINTSSTGTVNINFSGVGSILQPVPTENSFYSYNYLVVNNATSTVRAIQASLDLTNTATFPAGNYTVYGISYLTDNVDFTSFINQPFSNLQSAISGGNICAVLSNNNVVVNIQNNCQNAISLSGVASTGTQAVNQTITSTQIVNSGTSLTYRAGNSITLSSLTGSGFSAANGSVFKAEIGGCN